MFLPQEKNTRFFIVALSAVCAFLLMSANTLNTGLLIAFWTFGLLFLSFLLPIGPKWEGFDSVTRASFGLLYVVIPMATIALLRAKGEIDFPKSGGDWIYLGLLCTWIDDSFAYFAGRAFGKHPFFPSVSPKSFSMSQGVSTCRWRILSLNPGASSSMVSMTVSPKASLCSGHFSGPSAR